ncbi:MAG: virB8 family protein [Alphaproteobacteria bacterium]|nr:virB8 family protein [Alphaproteobacteria bacterium]
MKQILSPEIQETSVKSELVAARSSSWYQDRYENVKLQRNIFALLGIIGGVCVIVSVLVVGQISLSKSFSPFVVQIEESTGYAKIVNPANSKLLSADDSLARYFLTKYVSARESYNIVDFDFNMKNVVRIFSSQNVYRDYIGYIRNPDNDPKTIYGYKNSIYIKIRSITTLGDKYFIRFAVYDTTKDRQIASKIATATFNYLAMELQDSERDVNPVGFQITGYGVTDDKG